MLLLAFLIADFAVFLDIFPVFADCFTLLVLWDSALPAADFAALEALGFFNTFEAVLAAFFDVTLDGLLVCDKALPAAVLLFFDDEVLSVFDAFLAAFEPVTFWLFAIVPS